MLWFQSALLPEGWARDVRITVQDGRIAAIAANTPAEPGDERRYGLHGRLRTETVRL